MSYIVRKHIARMTGMCWFIVVDEDSDAQAEGTTYYDDHEDAQAAADRANEPEGLMTPERYAAMVEAARCDLGGHIIAFIELPAHGAKVDSAIVATSTNATAMCVFQPDRAPYFVWGHYDLRDREAAIADMHERAQREGVTV